MLSQFFSTRKKASEFIAGLPSALGPGLQTQVFNLLIDGNKASLFQPRYPKTTVPLRTGIPHESIPAAVGSFHRGARGLRVPDDPPTGTLQSPGALLAPTQQEAEQGRRRQSRSPGGKSPAPKEPALRKADTAATGSHS